MTNFQLSSRESQYQRFCHQCPRTFQYQPKMLRLEILVHRLRGSKMYFHQATKDRRILLIPGIHYFDAHRLQPLLLQASALQVHMRESPLVGPEGAGETVDDPSSEEEQATTASETEAQRVKTMTRTHLQRNHGACQSRRQWMILWNWKSKVLRTSWPP